MLRSINEDCVYEVDPATNKIVWKNLTDADHAAFVDIDKAMAEPQFISDREKWFQNLNIIRQKFRRFCDDEKGHQPRKLTANS